MTEPSIIFEDNHLLAINKPAGWLVQGDRTGDPTLTDWGKDYLKTKYNKPGAVFLTPVHRIDRPVSGAVLFARTDKALGRMTELFREREVEKLYIALSRTTPYPAKGALKHWLLKDEQKNIVKAFRKQQGGAKESELFYEHLGNVGNLQVIEVRPVTGRPHQIRVQLSAVGCSIEGDLKYGAPIPLEDASIGLHCMQMSFLHPVQKVPIVITASFPALAIWKGVNALFYRSKRTDLQDDK